MMNKLYFSVFVVYWCSQSFVTSAASTKTESLTILDLQNLLLETRDRLAETETHLKRFLDTTKRITDTETKLLEAEKRIARVETNPVPIGFIYIQLYNQPTPVSLWPTVNWSHISSNYAGLFFRAEGGKSAAFGSTQAEDSPRLRSATYYDNANPANNVTFTVGTVSNHLKVGSHNSAIVHHEGQAFLINYTDAAKPEVRPRNQAVRIWVRVA